MHLGHLIFTGICTPNRVSNHSHDFTLCARYGYTVMLQGQSQHTKCDSHNDLGNGKFGGFVWLKQEEQCLISGGAIQPSCI